MTRDGETLLAQACDWCREKEDTYDSLATTSRDEGRKDNEKAHAATARAFGACRSYLAALVSQPHPEGVAVVSVKGLETVAEELAGAALCALPPPGFPEKPYEARLRKAVDAAISAIRTKSQPLYLHPAPHTAGNEGLIEALEQIADDITGDWHQKYEKCRAIALAALLAKQEGEKQ